MAVRILFIFVLMSVVTTACDEVPYETSPLGVTSIVNHTVNQTQTFKYHKNKLYTYSSKGSAGDTLADMIFYYRDGELISFSSDSTKRSYKRSFIYKTNEGTVDSTYYFGLDTLGFVDTTYLFSRRVITYDSNNKPVSVSVKDIDTDELFTELTWSDGNVTHLTYAVVSPVSKLIVEDVDVEYDGQSCIFKSDDAYIYVLPMDQLYWVSKNNPAIFTNDSGKRTNTYVYNKIGYPSSFIDSEHKFGVTYKELR